ncbi:MAG: heat-inducible transcriptional repressor HrcA [Proteobacteria bacterium]|jgi:heat-inducible transcriptional repressor|nr:heat-inducible transcriptional repressor HrcA [Pseudomonadota bacterium]MCG6934258.1 heat-inducible transcriptional repressor HrcA [Pseudomonadota bacterium]
MSLLKTLVERYIQDGQPVGSRTLARDSGMNLSPATIRNVMSDLEDLGLVTSPHTSAGRIPTPQGYRLFVDRLLSVKPLRHSVIERLKHSLDSSGQERAIDSASSLLSEVTHLAGLVMLPRRETVILQHIEFLPLSANRVLVILIVNDQEVQNRIIHTDRDFDPEDLHRVANYLNAEFAGRELGSIRQRILRSMQQTRDDMHALMQTAVEMADQVVRTSQTHDYVIAGETNLMNYEEMADLEKLRQLFEAFHTKRDVLHVLDQSIHAAGIQIFIGEESGYSVFGECSVVTAPYRVDDEVVGVLGVIGPTRMAYGRVIPVVDVTAKILGSLLSSE